MTEYNVTTDLCPHCGRANPVELSACRYCGAPLHPATRPCPRCGEEVPLALATCPHCGAQFEAESALPAEGTGPASPSGWAQLGYLLLLIAGALIAVGGAGYVVVALIFGNATLDGALALAVIVIGLMIVLQSRRALDRTRWQELALAPGWVWAGLMVVVWGIGAMLVQLLPGRTEVTLPPLIVLASGLASLFFLRLTVRGLRASAAKEDVQDKLLPRHVVLLSAGLSSTFSTAFALVLEGVFLGVVMGVLLVGARLWGDASLLDTIEQIGQDPNAVQRLQELIVNSPAALAGLGSILVFIAPAVEEAAKGLPLFVFARQRRALTERTAILVGFASGVGFAFAENVGYMSMLADEWAVAFWLRAAAALMHGVASGFVGRAWYRGVGQGRWWAMLLDLGIAWGVHALWNTLALLVGWFLYQGLLIGVLFCAFAGLLPLTILFTVMVRWGIWVSDAP